MNLIKKNYLAKRLSFTTDIKQAITSSDIIFICVGTPTKKGSLNVDLSYVYKCCKKILNIQKKRKFLSLSLLCQLVQVMILKKYLRKRKIIYCNI